MGVFCIAASRGTQAARPEAERTGVADRIPRRLTRSRWPDKARLPSRHVRAPIARALGALAATGRAGL